jgi:hypothetical protein
VGCNYRCPDGPHDTTRHEHDLTRHELTREASRVVPCQHGVSAPWPMHDTNLTDPCRAGTAGTANTACWCPPEEERIKSRERKRRVNQTKYTYQEIHHKATLVHRQKSWPAMPHDGGGARRPRGRAQDGGGARGRAQDSGGACSPPAHHRRAPKTAAALMAAPTPSAYHRHVPTSAPPNPALCGGGGGPRTERQRLEWRWKG